MNMHTISFRPYSLVSSRLTVSTRIPDDDFAYDFATLKFFFQPQNLILWVPALGLAVLLRVITHKCHHQLIFPICMSLLVVCDREADLVLFCMGRFPGDTDYILYSRSSCAIKPCSITAEWVAIRYGKCRG